jgi:hypothetical protein
MDSPVNAYWNKSAISRESSPKSKLSPETQIFLEDLTWEDSENSVTKAPAKGRKRRLPMRSDFIPAIPRAWVLAAHLAKADLAPTLWLWRLTRLWRQGPRVPISTGRVARELHRSRQWVLETWHRLERAGLITIHERRPGRRLVVEIKMIES